MLTLGKRYKLCSSIAVDKLFARDYGVDAILTYPLRAVWRADADRRPASSDIRMLISVPKRRIKHAVDRVKLRRRTREAFRLNFRNYPAIANRSVDLAFVYIANTETDYAQIERAVCRILNRISSSLNSRQCYDAPQQPSETPSPNC